MSLKKGKSFEASVSWLQQGLPNGSLKNTRYHST